MIKPKVSIIIPVFNRESIIAETIECAIQQTFSNIEIIISDNNSDDNTWDIIQNYALKDKRIIAIRNEINLGPVLNWKAAFDKATGEYIKIIWSDDLITLDFIERAIEIFDDETAFIISGIQVFDNSSKKVIIESTFQSRFEYSTEEYLKDILINHKENFPVSPGCAIFRTNDIRMSFVEQIDNSENLDFRRYGAGNDLLFFLITANKYNKIRIIKSFSSFFRSHDSSLTISNDLNLYYEYSRWFFIENYRRDLLMIYKIRLTIMSFRHKRYKILAKSIRVKAYSFTAIGYFLKKLFSFN